MIVLDTHIWIWWVEGDLAKLSANHVRLIRAHETTGGMLVSAISCWEVAMLEGANRLSFALPIDQWLTAALRYPGIELAALSPEVAVESVRLPAPFHRDPADRIIVATARIHSCPLLTRDQRILSYSGVTSV
jgi:PIN domain nuclease of toxin-antitoxin system